MAGLTRDEELSLLTSKLTDPSITPAPDRDTLRDRIANGPPKERGIGTRLAEAAGELAPTQVGRVVLGPVGYAGAVAADTAGLLPKYDRTPPPKLKADPDLWAKTQQLAPMESAPAPVQAAPTLDPKYTQVGRSMGSGGAGGGPSPGLGLRGAVDAAHKRQLGIYDEAASLQRELGIDKAAAAQAMSTINQEEAARQQAEAERQRQQDEEAHAKNQAFLERNVQMADDLAKTKIDTRRLFRNTDAGTQFSMWTGAVLGGFLAGVNGTSNTSLDRLEKIVDRDIRAQETELDAKKGALSARNTIFGQMLSETGDRRVAAQATRNLMLEAAKLNIKAKADELGIPEIRTQAEIIAKGIEEKQQMYATKLAEDALAAYQRQVAAAAAARAAAEQRAFENALKVAEMNIKGQHAQADLIKAGKEGAKEDNTAITEASKRQGDAELISDGELIRNMMRHVSKGEKGDRSVMGFDTSSKMKMGALKGATLGLLPDSAASRVALGDEERIARQDWEQLALLFRKRTTGSGGSEQELADIRRAYEGAGSNAERLTVLDRLMAIQNKREASATAVLNDQQKAELARRNARDGVGPALPDTVRLK